MRYFILLLIILSLCFIPVFASDIEPGEIAGNTEPTYPYDLPLTFQLPNFSILIQPSSKVVNVGKSVSFSVVCDSIGVSYAWQYSIDGGSTWYRSTSSTQGYNTSRISIIATTARDGFMYRCIVSNYSGTIISDPATLTVVPAGSPSYDWSVGDIISLFTISVGSGVRMLSLLLDATGMYSFYVTAIIIFLVVSIIMSRLLGSRLGGKSDRARRRDQKGD